MESPHPAFDFLADSHPRLRRGEVVVVRHRATGLCFAVSSVGTYESAAFLVSGEGDLQWSDFAQVRPADPRAALAEVDAHLSGPPDWVWDESGKCPHCVGAEYPDWALAE